MNKAKSKGAQSKKKAEDERFRVVVIGASAGGHAAVTRLLAHLPEKTNAAIFVVLHNAPYASFSAIAKNATKSAVFNCKLATDGEAISPGTVYFAVEGTHLLLSGGHMRLGTAADVNLFKPSIDVLFRSAAVSFRERTIGVILSGLLDDGVSGMEAIKQCGGKCIVQDPADAEQPFLPNAVLKIMKPDYKLPAHQIGEAIKKLSNTRARKPGHVPDSMLREARITEELLTDINDVRKLGSESLFTCPDCGGVLWHISEHGRSRYRCFTGHAYTENLLLQKQGESLELTLWVALRMFEERKKLISKLKGMKNADRRLGEIEQHIDRLKSLLNDLQKIVILQESNAEKKQSKT